MIVGLSPLGREVKNDFDLHCDEVLLMLYEWHQDPSNPQDQPMGSWIFAEKFDISMLEAEDICRYLSGDKERKEKFIEHVQERTRMNESGQPVSLGMYRITPQGIAEVTRYMTAYNT